MSEIQTKAPLPRPALRESGVTALHPPSSGEILINNRDPNGPWARIKKLLSVNWENCDPKYWEFQPDHRYRFSIKELRHMKCEKIVTTKEIRLFYNAYDLTGKKMVSANLLSMPYALSDWLIKRRERTIREDEKLEELIKQEKNLRYITPRLFGSQFFQ